MQRFDLHHMDRMGFSWHEIAQLTNITYTHIGLILLALKTIIYYETAFRQSIKVCVENYSQPRYFNKDAPTRFARQTIASIEDSHRNILMLFETQLKNTRTDGRC